MQAFVSYRTSQDGRREFETSELIRAYGELKQDETPERHSAGQAENPHDQQTERILRELNELKQCLTLMLEDKQAQDTERRRQEAEREQLQNEIAQLRQGAGAGKETGILVPVVWSLNAVMD